jgi:DHA2 family multidrug resistance protein-like MFS transporter
MSDASAASAVPARAGRREWIGLGVIALPCLLYSMDLTVLFLAIPSLSRDLAPSATQLLWISDVYGFMVAGSLITMGTLGDRIGRRKLLLIGAAFFGVTSILAAFAPTAEMLIVARALLGIAGATVAPSTLSLIRNMFHDEGQRTFAIGVWITSYSVGGLIGPVVGGILLEQFWWGSVFLLAVPVMVLILIVGPRLLPEYRDPGAGRLDLYSAAQSIVAVLAVIYGIKRIAAGGVDAVAAGIIAFGVVVGIAFVRRQRRLSDPLIDLRLFENTAFSASLATYLLTVFVFFGVGLFVAQYLQLVAGLSPLRAGLWTLPGSIAFIVSSLMSPKIVTRFRPATVMAACLVLTAIGFLVIAQVDGPDDVMLIVIGSLIYGMAGSPVVTLATDIVVGSAPPERAGSASAISETSAEFGGAMSIAILGSIGTAVYRTVMDDIAAPGVPAEALDNARKTLAGAVEAAQQHPEAASALVAQAREAFIRSFDFTVTVSLAIALGTALLAGVLLRHLPARSGSPAHGS